MAGQVNNSAGDILGEMKLQETHCQTSWLLKVTGTCVCLQHLGALSAEHSCRCTAFQLRHDTTRPL